MDNLVFRSGERFRKASGYSVSQEAVICSALCEFLSRNHLSATDLPNLENADWNSFELRFSHLTEDGLAVMKLALQKWMNAIDRGKSPSDTAILERALARIRHA